MLGTTRGDVLFIPPQLVVAISHRNYGTAQKNTPDWARWSFKSTDGGWIDETFVEEAKASMDPILWRQEFQASIEIVARCGVYSDFNRDNIAPVDFGEMNVSFLESISTAHLFAAASSKSKATAWRC